MMINKLYHTSAVHINYSNYLAPLLPIKYFKFTEWLFYSAINAEMSPGCIAMY